MVDLAALGITSERLQKLSPSELKWLDGATKRMVWLEAKEACEASLPEFIKQSWHVVEPGNPYVHGWHIDAICEHLEAITNGVKIEGKLFNRLLINCPPGAMKPVHVDEPILTRRGYIPLREILVGDEVLTHRGRYRRVTALHEQGIIPTVEVATYGGRTVRAAPDHPFLTPRGWVPAGELTTHDYVGVPRRRDSCGDGNLITPQEARLLGYLVGDGCISHRSLAFVNADEDIIADFIECAASLGFYAYAVTHPNKGVRAKKVVLRSSTQKRSRHSNGELPILVWLQRHGLYLSNSYSKRIPPAVMASGEGIIENFVGAYWSCDGMFAVRHENRRTTMIGSLTSVSKELAADMQRACAILNIDVRLRTKSIKLETKRQPGGTYVSYIVATTQRSEVGKFSKMQGLCPRKRKLASKGFADRFEPDVYADEVISVTPSAPGECRCLSVEEDHSFTANGLAVHNSLLVNVFWPSWEWGPKNLPHLRYVCVSHAQDLSIRDSMRMRRLVMSEWYQERWGKRVSISEDQNQKSKFENTATGFRQAAAAGSVTGARGDRVLVDDPHSVEGGTSDTMRETTVQWFLEAVPTRVNNPKESAIVVIMQRLHEEDVSGIIISKNLGYEHLCLPMRFEEGRRCETGIGFVDARGNGDLLFPERFPEEVVARDEEVLGPFATAGQYQQRPEPRGGGILKTEWWQEWDDEAARIFGVPNAESYPQMELILASVDTAYTTKEENDPSAMTVWGLFRDPITENPQLMLMHAWAKRLELHGPAISQKKHYESDAEYLTRCKAAWGLTEWVMHTCKKNKVDKLLIEAKASGISVYQEIRRLQSLSDWQTSLINPGAQDKVSRAYAVQPIFAAGQIWAPSPSLSWVDIIISQCASFPKAAHDDLVDSLTQAINWFRVSGLLKRPAEVLAEHREQERYKKKAPVLYDV